MRKLLIISAYAPYSKVGHAGGKTHWFYLNQYIHQYDTFLITFGTETQKEQCENEWNSINLKYKAHFTKNDNLLSKVLYRMRKFNVLDKYSHFIVRELKNSVIDDCNELKRYGYQPDIILLEWTQIALLVDDIKNIFPNSKIIISAHDVVYQAYKRKIHQSSLIHKPINYLYYRRIERLELKSLDKSDLILFQSQKDVDLVSEFLHKGKNDYFVISSYFNNMFNIKRKSSGNSILFYGAMNRQENYLSAIWFIENVMSKLYEYGYKFYVVGGNPDKSLKKYDGIYNTVVTGFVDDISPFFATSKVFVAPLLLGAGIKVKIIEAMSSGIPVITNNIGIEGINAVNGEEYINCDTPEDYIKSILLSEDFLEGIGNKGKELIYKSFDLSSSATKLLSVIDRLCDKNG